MKIYLLWHAQSTFNKYKTDDIDCDLTEEGIKQAKKLEGYFDHVICSPLKRTMKTLNLSNIKYKSHEINDICREYKIDKCDFMEGEDIVFETKKELEDRIEKFRSYLLSLKKKSILVVTHSDFIFNFTKKIVDGEEFGVDAENAELIEHHL